MSKPGLDSNNFGHPLLAFPSARPFDQSNSGVDDRAGTRADSLPQNEFAPPLSSGIIPASKSHHGQGATLETGAHSEHPSLNSTQTVPRADRCTGSGEGAANKLV